MSRYRRSHEGQVDFFTVVTHERKPLFTSDLSRKLFQEAIQSIQRERPFGITGIVLWPEHRRAVSGIASWHHW